jgi:hypothetical protein
MNSSRCSRKGSRRTSTILNSVDAVGGGQTSGPIPAPRRSAPTPAEASRTTRRSNRRQCSRTPFDLTNRGDVAIDSFLGSGSTLIAAEKTGRVCRGVELDPLYVDVIVRRYEAVTGNPAILVETGETFERLGARRARKAAPV